MRAPGQFSWCDIRIFTINKSRTTGARLKTLLLACLMASNALAIAWLLALNDVIHFVILLIVTIPRAFVSAFQLALEENINWLSQLV